MMKYLSVTKKILASLSTLVLISFFCVPVFVSAQGAQIPPSPSSVSQVQNNVAGTNPSAATAAKQTGITYQCGDGPTAGNCTFADFVTAAQNVVVFMRNIALMFSVVVIAYAGFKYMISGDNPKARGDANNMLQKGAIGIAVILGAWLIVHLIVSALVSPAVLQNSAVTI